MKSMLGVMRTGSFCGRNTQAFLEPDKRRLATSYDLLIRLCPSDAELVQYFAPAQFLQLFHPRRFPSAYEFPTRKYILQSAHGKHYDPRTDRRALVEIDDILVDHSDAAGRNTLADGPRFDGAVNAVERVLVALPEVHGAGTERIARATGADEVKSVAARRVVAVAAA